MKNDARGTCWKHNLRPSKLLVPFSSYHLKDVKRRTSWTQFSRHQWINHAFIYLLLAELKKLTTRKYRTPYWQNKIGCVKAANSNVGNRPRTSIWSPGQSFAAQAAHSSCPKVSIYTGGEYQSSQVVRVSPLSVASSKITKECKCFPSQVESSHAKVINLFWS